MTDAGVVGAVEAGPQSIRGVTASDAGASLGAGPSRHKFVLGAETAPPYARHVAQVFALFHCCLPDAEHLMASRGRPGIFMVVPKGDARTVSERPSDRDHNIEVLRHRAARRVLLRIIPRVLAMSRRATGLRCRYRTAQRSLSRARRRGRRRSNRRTRAVPASHGRRLIFVRTESPDPWLNC